MSAANRVYEAFYNGDGTNVSDMDDSFSFEDMTNLTSGFSWTFENGYDEYSSTGILTYQYAKISRALGTADGYNGNGWPPFSMEPEYEGYLGWRVFTASTGSAQEFSFDTNEFDMSGAAYISSLTILTVITAAILAF